MANKKDVHDAFYEGVCVVLTAYHDGGEPLSYIDTDEFRKFVEGTEYEELATMIMEPT